MGSANTGTVTLTFPSPVYNIHGHSVYSCPPTCPTTEITYTAYGPDDTTVVESGPLGKFTDFTGTIHHSFDLRGDGLVKRIVLTPPAPMPPDRPGGFALEFGFDYSVVCPPTGDSVLDEEAVREQLLDFLAQSRPDPNSPVGKKEFGGYIYRRDDGSHFLTLANAVTATDCGFTLPEGSPPAIPGATYAGKTWHTHPSRDEERLFQCSWAKPGDIIEADRDPRHGGGSPKDWEAADNSGSQFYVINLDKNVYRLDPDTPVNERGANPNQWRFTTEDWLGECLVPA